MLQEKNLRKLYKELEWDSNYIAENLAVEFAQNVYERLRELNIKKNDLAQYMNVSRAHVTQILNGKSNITFKTIAKIASALKIKVCPPFFPKIETPQNILSFDSGKEFSLKANDFLSEQLDNSETKVS
jgi:transcriptional regulator with XRE-family HTH domain